MQMQVPEEALRRMQEQERKWAREGKNEGRKPMNELEAAITHYRREYERTVEPKVCIIPYDYWYFWTSFFSQIIPFLSFSHLSTERSKV